MCNYLTVDIPGLTTPALERHGLYELIRGTGIRLRAAVQTIGARSASASEARLLDEPKRAPLLTMERTAYDDHGRAVEHGTHVYRASRYCFEQSMLGH
jgi:DNA-binding GntR family transcriptional regulator